MIMLLADDYDRTLPLLNQATMMIAAIGIIVPALFTYIIYNSFLRRTKERNVAVERQITEFMLRIQREHAMEVIREEKKRTSKQPVL